MNMLMITQYLYDSKSPFNHLLEDMFEAFSKNNINITRIMAIPKNDNAYVEKDKQVAGYYKTINIRKTTQ